MRIIETSDKSSIWSIEYEDEAQTCSSYVSNSIRNFRHGTNQFFRTARTHVLLPLQCFLLFLLLGACGLYVIYLFRESHYEQLNSNAMMVAKDTSARLTYELEKSLAPMYSLAEVVKNNETYLELSSRVNNTSIEAGDKRSISGICDDPSLVLDFDGLAVDLKDDSGRHGIVTNVRLLPMGVTCLVSPKVNREDYGTADDILYYDSTDDIGRDWLLSTSEEDQITIEEALRTHQSILVGPSPLHMHDGVTLLTYNNLRVYLSFKISNQELIYNNVNYSSWGFVQLYINFDALVSSMDIMERLDDQGMLLEILSTNTLTANKAQTVTNTSPNTPMNPDHTVSLSTQTANTIFAIKIGYTPATIDPTWLIIAVACVIAISSVFSFIVLMVLVEKQQHKDLLFKMLPKRAIRKLKNGKKVAECYKMVTIFFSDIVGFTSMSEQMSPIEVMAMLNDLYKEFDKLVEKHKVYKVETIGDAYMVLGGAPDRCLAREGAEKVANFAVDVIDRVKRLRTKKGEKICIRVGLASGPVVAGVVGKAMPRYCFFGDTVNFASRMESTSVKMRIQCSDLTQELLTHPENPTGFIFEERIDEESGKAGVEMKGKGFVHTWWITGNYKKSDVTRGSKMNRKKSMNTVTTSATSCSASANSFAVRTDSFVLRGEAPMRRYSGGGGTVGRRDSGSGSALRRDSNGSTQNIYMSKGRREAYERRGSYESLVNKEYHQHRIIE